MRSEALGNKRAPPMVLLSDKNKLEAPDSFIHRRYLLLIQDMKGMAGGEGGCLGAQAAFSQ